MSKLTETAKAPELDAEFITALKLIFEEKITFNKVLGLHITAMSGEGVSAQIRMKPELVGHYSHNRVHGGVISASLDAMGGVAVMAAIGVRHTDEPVPKRLERFSKLGTIDLRVDYLRPGIGTLFELRSRVASTRMEFMNSDGKLLATGAGAYIVS